LAEIPIPVPSHKKDVIKIIELVKGLERSVFELASSDEMSAMEDRLQTLVDETLATVKV
jgi:hypothetical protein